jgi:heterodisulfide reductase subunit A-like polyferredoxin
MFGQDERVMTQTEFTKLLDEKGGEEINTAVMIQCVGSRNEESPNCSRICCQTAVKNALHLKELNPEALICVLYRDIRTYGLLEDYYEKARSLGVLFFRYAQDQPPRVLKTDQGLAGVFSDHVTGRSMRAAPDAVVLSAGMRPNDTEELGAIMKAARNVDGYFLEAHVKLRPVDMAADGVFVCGAAHGPKLISEAIAQAMAAAARAGTLLSQTELTLSPITSTVDPDLCAACLVCVLSCPYGAPRINQDGVSEIDQALCRGCGICAAECPAKAIELRSYQDDQILSQVEALMEGVLS